MTTLAIHRETNAIALPAPRMGPITIRPAALPPEGGADVMFIDRLQKMHSNAVGFRPRDQIEARIKAGHVLIAQDPATTERIGYIMFADKYFKREDLGIVYQLNVAPHKQRGLVGAALLKAAFEACPWGVKLFCCWCAQDLAACHFWESIGFVPIAFRAGSRGKQHGGRRKEGRMQIFWQRRIREGDEGPGATPYWYPTETSGGSMKENRIVLPILAGKHWSDELPFVLPGMERSNNEPRALASGDGAANGEGQPLPDGRGSSAKRVRKAEPATPDPPARPKRGLWFAPPAPPPPSPEELKAAKAAAPKSKREKQPRPPRCKNDPKLVAAAREFRDRYLDEVNSGRMLPAANGKYDVSRQLAAGRATASWPTASFEPVAMPLLNAA